MTQDIVLTQAEAARLYAKAWNTKDVSVLEPYLADNLRYESQNVITDLESKQEFIEYFKGNIELALQAEKEDFLHAELGVTMAYKMYKKSGEPCVLLSKDDKDNVVALVLFELYDSQISRIEYCTLIPDPQKAHRSGEYPE